MKIPANSHVHTEWSWDAPNGSMRASCERALEPGVPAVAFTEHVDHTVWRVAMEGLAPDDHLVRMAEDGRLHPPAFDAAGYLAEIDECRNRYPNLRILGGLDLGEPHRHEAAVNAVLGAGNYDRALGSVHTLADGAEYAEPPGLFERREAAKVMRDYLVEVARLAASPMPFEVLAHIDYPLRSWPAAVVRFDAHAFEDEFRHALGATANSGRALEVSTQVTLHATILQWWRDEGGSAITFGSDEHDPQSVARGFREAMDMADAFGFRPGPMPHELWGRC